MSASETSHPLGRLLAAGTIILLLLLVYSVFQGTQAGLTVSQAINSNVQPVTNLLSAIIFFEIPLGLLIEGSPGLPVIVVWLFGFALYWSVFLGFINFKGARQSLRIVSGRYDDPNDPGEVTHFQALTAALSGTVGLGNIAGVAVAISLGGPGATFWMILAGLFGMTSKFAECTMSVHYREINEEGVVSGGPMYYLSKGLAKIGKPQLGKSLAVVFALLCIAGAFGAGAMYQVNQSAAQFTAVAVDLTGGENSIFFGRTWIYGTIFAVFVGLVIIGGIRQITHVTEYLVPIMAGIYMTGALIVLSFYLDQIPAAFGLIVTGAFSPEGVQGGIVGVLIMGLRRAAFSNEAGVGSAPIAHAAAKTKEPVSEGLVALLEPFVDTVLVCTMTALVIIVTGIYKDPSIGDGIAMTSAAFDGTIGGFKYILSVAVVLFAFSTTITWFYYGQRSFLYLVGDKPQAELLFKGSFLLALIVGASMQLTAVMDFADATLMAMGFPNLLGLYLLRHELKALMEDYWGRLTSGKIRPYADKEATEA